YERYEQDLVFLGVVGIIDPPRPEAREAIAQAYRAGVRVMMITGDHPRTAARIAADLGIAEEGEPVLLGAELERLGEDELRERVRPPSVYARVAPEHKLRIVDALQDDDNIVAMTGDGVNDSPALRSADIGVAMGITGTEVSKEAADMILADDNFATIVSAVREGRAIFANIRSFLRYLLTSHAGEVLTMFLGVVASGVIGIHYGEGIHVPLLATQILWINLLTDTGPALAIGVDPPPPGGARPGGRPTGSSTARCSWRSWSAGSRWRCPRCSPSTSTCPTDWSRVTPASARPAPRRSPRWSWPSCGTASTPAATGP